MSAAIAFGKGKKYLTGEDFSCGLAVIQLIRFSKYWSTQHNRNDHRYDLRCLAIIEKEQTFALHQTPHNSSVIHSDLLRARWPQVSSFASRRWLPYCGSCYCEGLFLL